MHYTSSNTWRPGRQTMLNINPWETVPYEQTHTGATDKHVVTEHHKYRPNKGMTDSRNGGQH